MHLATKIEMTKYHWNTDDAWCHDLSLHFQKAV